LFFRSDEVVVKNVHDLNEFDDTSISVKFDASRLFETWEGELELVMEGFADAPCSFLSNHSIKYESDTACNRAAASKLAPAIAKRGVLRASACARKTGFECVVGPEIGLSVPTFFVFHEGEMKAFVVPEAVNVAGENHTIDVLTVGHDSVHRHVRLMDVPSVVSLSYVSETGAHVKAFNSTAVASCYFLLRQAFSSACWANLRQ
jgi:hypothetical protein